MNRKQSVKSQMFRRVQQFGDTYRSQFPEASPIGQAFARLATTVDAFMQDAAAQHTRAREGRERHQSARAALLFRLKALTRTARVIARSTPEGAGFDDRFAMPDGKRNSVILAAGKGLLAEAEPFAAQFIAHGLADSFIADLRNAVADYEKASNAREAGKLARASASVGLQAAEAAGMAAVDAIEVIVRYQFAQDLEMQAAWTRARRQDGLPLVKVDTTAATSSPPPSSPAPSPDSRSRLAENVPDSPVLAEAPAIEPAA